MASEVKKEGTARSRAVRTAWITAVVAVLVYIAFVAAAVSQAS
jgi:hypothetical protein